MPRKREVPKREVLPDPIYNDRIVSKFISNLMRKGKKSTAERIFYRALDEVGKKSKESPLEVFKKALDNVKPRIEVKSRRVGGSTYQVPVDVRSERQMALAMRWLISYARARTEKTMEMKLAGEILDAAKNHGASVKKREDTHKMAEANRAFAHYRW